MSNFEKKIIESIENEFENNILLPDYESIMLYLYYIVVYTGQCNIMFCNSFIQEAIQLLKNSLILYKKGFFDCAFYSIRQSSEVMDSMLYLAKSPSEKVYDWKSKNYFPVDSKVRQQLEKISNDYKEINTNDGYIQTFNPNFCQFVERFLLDTSDGLKYEMELYTECFTGETVSLRENINKNIH